MTRFLKYAILKLGTQVLNQELREALLQTMEHKAFISPRQYDCGCWSNDMYYYEDKKGNTICRKCYLQLVKRGFDKKWLSPLIKAANKIIKEEEAK